MFTSLFYPEFSWEYWYIYLLGIWVGLKGPHMVGGRFTSIWIGVKWTPQPGRRSFYKPFSKKCGLNIRAPVTIQRYENMSGYDNICGISVIFSVKRIHSEQTTPLNKEKSYWITLITVMIMILKVSIIGTGNKCIWQRLHRGKFLKLSVKDLIND